MLRCISTIPAEAALAGSVLGRNRPQLLHRCINQCTDVNVLMIHNDHVSQFSHNTLTKVAVLQAKFMMSLRLDAGPWAELGLVIGQDNAGCLGWALPQEDFRALSNFDYQARCFEGQGFLNEQGPWRTYEELWDEKKPA